MALVDDLRRENDASMPKPIAVDPESDKVTRMATQAAKLEAGQVFLPHNAAWLDEFKSELLQFPHGRHDDQVDSLSQFLIWIQKRREASLSCTWIDLRPTIGDGWPMASSWPPDAPPVPPLPPNVLVRVPGTGLLVTQQDYAKQIEAAVRKAKARVRGSEDGES
jgi:hypothetical protein